MNANYNDIILLERPKSRFPKMSRQARAAQFAPFAALSGYEEEVEEASRFVDEKPMVDEHELERINQILKDAIEFDDEIDLIVFVPDIHKVGGTIARVNSKIKRYQDTDRKLVLQNGKTISIENIIGIKTIDSPLDQSPW